MNTPAHLLIGAVAFAKPNAPKVNAAALIGAIAPDVSLYILSAWSLLIMDQTPRYVFDELYFSPTWQRVFAVDNSFVLWAALFAIAWGLRRQWLIAFSGAGILHLLADFLLHNEDARAQFWPISDWVFHSPISYWDPNHYGHIFGPLEIALSLVLGIILWRRFHNWLPRLVISLTVLLQSAPMIVFGFLP